MKKACVSGLKLVSGDYFGVMQGLSYNKTAFQRILRVPGLGLRLNALTGFTELFPCIRLPGDIVYCEFTRVESV